MTDTADRRRRAPGMTPDRRRAMIVQAALPLVVALLMPARAPLAVPAPTRAELVDLLLHGPTWTRTPSTRSGPGCATVACRTATTRVRPTTGGWTIHYAPVGSSSAWLCQSYLAQGCRSDLAQLAMLRVFVSV